jgi:hypothetical protein
MTLRGPFLVDELDDLRHQLGGDHNHGLIVIIQGVFDFRDLLVLGHVVVVLRQLADLFFGPAFLEVAVFSSFSSSFLSPFVPPISFQALSPKFISGDDEPATALGIGHKP